jgi:hypothetical protein
MPPSFTRMSRVKNFVHERNPLTLHVNHEKLFIENALSPEASGNEAPASAYNIMQHYFNEAHLKQVMKLFHKENPNHLTT